MPSGHVTTDDRTFVVQTIGVNIEEVRLERQ